VIGNKPTRNQKASKEEACKESKDKETTGNYEDIEIGVIKRNEARLTA
jgi:hypothetical protein